MNLPQVIEFLTIVVVTTSVMGLISLTMFRLGWITTSVEMKSGEKSRQSITLPLSDKQFLIISVVLFVSTICMLFINYLINGRP